MEPDAEGENWVDNCSTSLSILRPVRKTDSLNERRTLGELLTKVLKEFWLNSWDVVGKVVEEEVPACLAINWVHSDETGRIHVISKKFKPHGWSKFFYFNIWLSGSTKTNETIICTFENAGERVLAIGS